MVNRASDSGEELVNIRGHRSLSHMSPQQQSSGSYPHNKLHLPKVLIGQGVVGRTKTMHWTTFVRTMEKEDKWGLLRQWAAWRTSLIHHDCVWRQDWRWRESLHSLIVLWSTISHCSLHLWALGKPLGPPSPFNESHIPSSHVASCILLNWATVTKNGEVAQRLFVHNNACLSAAPPKKRH